MSDQRSSTRQACTAARTSTWWLGTLLVSACSAHDVSVGAWSPTVEPNDAGDLPDATSELPDAPTEAAEPDAAPEPTFPYVEAESAALSGGFVIGKASGASGGEFLQPPAGGPLDEQPGPARAVYQLEIPKAGDYLIWGRIRSPGAANNRFWFQLDGGAIHKWRISVGDIWYWDTFHDDAAYGIPLVFPLSAGRHELILANCVEGVGLDRLYLSAVGDMPPGNDTPCNPPHSIEVAGTCLPSCGAQRGNMCGEAACSGKKRITAYDCAVCCAGP